MLIPSPWRNLTTTRCVCKTPKGDVVVLGSSRGEIEVPEGTAEAVITPVKITGRGGVNEPIGPSKIWSEAWGLLDVEDHAKKVSIVEEGRKLAEKQEADRKRRQKKAKEEAKVKPVEVATEIKMDDDLKRPQFPGPKPEKR